MLIFEATFKGIIDPVDSRYKWDCPCTLTYISYVAWPRVATLGGIPLLITLHPGQLPLEGGEEVVEGQGDDHLVVDTHQAIQNGVPNSNTWKHTQQKTMKIHQLSITEVDLDILNRQIFCSLSNRIRNKSDTKDSPATILL